MKDEILLSIIIPIYNVEKYLEVCIKSVLNQIANFKYEVLLINDGSRDNSDEICKKIEKENINVKYYYKQNGGLSDARNYGLKLAKGKYVYFLDSDDLVSENFFEKISSKIQDDFDIIFFDAEEIDENGEKIAGSFYVHRGLKENKIMDGKSSIELQLKENKEFQTAVWLGIYNLKFLIKNNMFFEKGLLHEDEMWTPKVILNSNKNIYINEKLYLYRKRENSIMTTKVNRNKNVKAMIYIFNTLYDYYDFKIEDNEFRKIIKDNLSKRYLHAISKWNFSKYKREKNRIDKKNIFRNSHAIKNILRAIILKINVNLYCLITKKKEV